MTHTAYTQLTPAQRDAYDALLDVPDRDNGLNHMIEVMRRSTTAEAVAGYLNDFATMGIDNPSVMIAEFGKPAWDAILRAAGVCECEGYCWHLTTV